MAEYIAKEIIGEVGEKKMRIGVAMNIPLEPIVRCRDCKHFKEDGCRCRYFLSQYPSEVDDSTVKGVITMSYVDPNGFCAWAERDA